MLRQAVRKLVTEGRTNVPLGIYIRRRNIGSKKTSDRKSENNSNYPDQADGAVAIFEKITRTEALISLLSREISTELRQNIVLNPDRSSKLRHIEVTHDKIRLEYSQVTPQFTKFASLMQASTEEQSQYPAFLVPVDSINLTWCGGGATLVLSKRDTLHYLTRTQQALRVAEGKEQNTADKSGDNSGDNER